MGTLGSPKLTGHQIQTTKYWFCTVWRGSWNSKQETRKSDQQSKNQARENAWVSTDLYLCWWLPLDIRVDFRLVKYKLGKNPCIEQQETAYKQNLSY